MTKSKNPVSNQVNNTLNLCNKKIDLEQIQKLSELLNGNKLKIVNVQECYIEEEAAKLLAESLNRHKLISEISFMSNVTTDFGRIYLLRVISSGKNLASLSLDNQLLDKQWSQLLSFALANNTSLATLSLNNCQLTIDGLEQLMPTLSNKQTLDEISFARNNLNDQAVEIITKNLTKNSNIETIDLSFNKITNLGAQALLNLIKKNQSIINLNLKGNNDISPEMIVDISKQLSSNRLDLTVFDIMIRKNTNLLRCCEKKDEKFTFFEQESLGYLTEFESLKEPYRSFLKKSLPVEKANEIIDAIEVKSKEYLFKTSVKEAAKKGDIKRFGELLNERNQPILSREFLEGVVFNGSANTNQLKLILEDYCKQQEEHLNR